MTVSVSIGLPFAPQFTYPWLICQQVSQHLRQMTVPSKQVEPLLQTKRKEILRLAAPRGAYNVRVFGSVARGEAGPESDVDFLVN